MLRRARMQRGTGQRSLRRGRPLSRSLCIHGKLWPAFETSSLSVLPEIWLGLGPLAHTCHIFTKVGTWVGICSSRIATAS